MKDKSTQYKANYCSWNSMETVKITFRSIRTKKNLGKQRRMEC